MVEMVETAAILNRASDRSFVILDEIGRGTATYDGLAIAWATLEHLHEANGCRTLFATHYHELTSLRHELDRLSCHSMKVREWQGEIIFLHQVVDGAADRSYGVHVARLAGLPAAVIARAQTLLSEMEAGGHGVIDAERLAGELPLFTQDFSTMATAADDPLRDRLETVNPDLLAPREALGYYMSFASSSTHRRMAAHDSQTGGIARRTGQPGRQWRDDAVAALDPAA